MRAISAYLVCFAVLFSAVSAGAAVRDYQSCVLLSERTPAKAVTQAAEWRDLGGGQPAQHCLALALIADGQAARGAEILEELAAAATRAAAVELYGQAGNGWLLADRPGQAHSAFSKALAVPEIAPELERDVRLDRGRAAAILEEYASAQSDFSRVLELDPGYGMGLLYRATVHRLTGDLAAAESDIMAAQKALPGNVDVLFELGNIASLREDFELARSCWESVIEKAPNTPVADASKMNLDNLAELLAERAALRPVD